MWDGLQTPGRVTGPSGRQALGEADQGGRNTDSASPVTGADSAREAAAPGFQREAAAMRPRVSEVPREYRDWLGDVEPAWTVLAHSRPTGPRES